MEFAKLETAALAHVGHSYFYGAYCRKCKHAARLSLVKLRAHLGDAFPLVKVKDRLRCERCSSRQIVITFLAPEQRTGNLAHLFRETHAHTAMTPNAIRNATSNRNRTSCCSG
jgi:hypothetical protein